MTILNLTESWICNSGAALLSDAIKVNSTLTNLDLPE